jgi:pyruvate/2-oxoglutarate dehydrogenase complex dihydrolipoamide dehydrogenase (E3) component
MRSNKTNPIELDTDILDDHEFEYTAVVIGRDLSSYLIALLLKQHGHQVAIASRSEAPILVDLSEYLTLKYLFEATERFHSIPSRLTEDFDIKSDGQMFEFDWQKLTNECKQEYLETKERLERELEEKNIAIYEGNIIIVEDYTVRVISPGIDWEEIVGSPSFLSHKMS